MARLVKIVIVTGTISSEGFWEPGTVGEYPDEQNIDEEYNIGEDWAPEVIATAAATFLRSGGYGHAYSSWPNWSPEGSYVAEAIVDSRTGYREEATARLAGFSRQESQLVYAKVFAGRHA